MKKILTVLALITALSVSVPAFASPPHQGQHHHGNVVRTFPHHHPPMMMPPPPRPFYGSHHGIVIQTGYPIYRSVYNPTVGHPYYRYPYRPVSGIGFYIGL